MNLGVLLQVMFGVVSTGTFILGLPTHKDSQSLSFEIMVVGQRLDAFAGLLPALQAVQSAPGL